MPSKTTEPTSPANETHQINGQAPATYSVNKAAERLSVHRSTIARLLHDGTLGFFRIGTRIIIPAENLQRYVDHLKQQSTTTNAVH
jgi:excisionase family DNA binding protein